MIVTLAEMKTYLGIADASYDSFLTQQLTMVNSAIENYCGRKFDPITYTETIYKDELLQKNYLDKIYLYHYPVNSVTSVTDEDGKTYTIRLQSDVGKIVNVEDGDKTQWFYDHDELTIVYEAGFTTMPEDLKQAVYSIVSESYNKKINGIDVSFGNNVQRVSVAGVMSIDYDYTLTSNDRSSAFGMILGDWLNVVDFYRSERALQGKIEETYVS